MAEIYKVVQRRGLAGRTGWGLVKEIGRETLARWFVLPSRARVLDNEEPRQLGPDFLLVQHVQ